MGTNGDGNALSELQSELQQLVVNLLGNDANDAEVSYNGDRTVRRAETYRLPISAALGDVVLRVLGPAHWERWWGATGRAGEAAVLPALPRELFHGGSFTPRSARERYITTSTGASVATPY